MSFELDAEEAEFSSALLAIVPLMVPADLGQIFHWTHLNDLGSRVDHAQEGVNTPLTPEQTSASWTQRTWKDVSAYCLKEAL